MATKWFLPAFPDPAGQMPPITLLLPALTLRSSCTSLPVRAPRLCRWQQGVQTPGVGGLAAPGVCMEVQRAVRAWLGRKERGGGREKGSQLLAPAWLFLARLSDCYRSGSALSWVSPWLSGAQKAEKWEVLVDDFFLVSVSVGGSLQGGSFQGARAAGLRICYLCV